MLRNGDTKSIVVGRYGDERTVDQRLLNGEFTLRGTLVGTIDGVVVIEDKSHGCLGLLHDVAQGDGGRECDGLAFRVGRRVDIVVGRHVLGFVADRVGDVNVAGGLGLRPGFGLGIVWMAGCQQAD